MQWKHVHCRIFYFQLTWLISQCAEKTDSKPALFQGFYKEYRGDTEANAANNLKSAIRQVAEGKRLLLILPVDFFFTCLPVPSVLSELAILSVSLSLDDFFSPFLCVCVSDCHSPSQPPPLSLSLRGSLWSYQSLHRGRQWCCMAFLCLLMS